MKSKRNMWRVAGVLVCALALLTLCALTAFAYVGETCVVDVCVELEDADENIIIHHEGLEGVTFDVYIDDTLVAESVSDWNGEVPLHRTVTVTNPRASGDLYANPNDFVSQTMEWTGGYELPVPVFAPRRIEIQPVVEPGSPENGSVDGYYYDVYVGDTLVREGAQGTAQVEVPLHGSYEIKNIRTQADIGTNGYPMPSHYGVSGTADASGTVELPLPPLVNKVDVNVIVDEFDEYWSGIDETPEGEPAGDSRKCTYDVYLEDTKIADDVTDFNAYLPYNFTLTVQDVKVQGGCLTRRTGDAYSKRLDSLENTIIWVGLQSHPWSAAAATPGADGFDGEIVYTCPFCGETRSFEYADLGEIFDAVIGESLDEVFYSVANESGELAVEEYPGGDAARWCFERLENGAYRIVSAEDGLALTALESSTDGRRGFDLALAEPDDSLEQAFYLSRSGYDVYYYQIVSAKSPDTMFNYGFWDGGEHEDFLTIGGSEGWWVLRVIEDLGDDFRGELRFSADRNMAAAANGSNVEFAEFDGGAAQRWHFVRQKNGAYRITDENDTLALTAVPDQNGAALAACTGSDDQSWYIIRQPGSSPVRYYLQPVSSGCVLGRNEDGQGGSVIGLRDIYYFSEVQWSIARYADLGGLPVSMAVNAVAGKAVRNRGFDNLEQGDCSDEIIWRFIPVGNGAFTVYDIVSGFLWTLEGDDESGYNVVLRESANAENQQWFFYEDYYNEYQSFEQPGHLFIRPAVLTYMMDLEDGNPAEGTNVRAWEMHGGGAEQWLLLERVADNSFYAEIFANAFDCALTNDTGLDDPLIFESYTGEEDQLWYFESRTDDNYRIRSGYAGDYLTWDEENNKVVLAAADGSDAQIFELFKGHDGAFYIRPLNGPFLLISDGGLGVSDTADAKYHRFTLNTYGVVDSVSLSPASVTFNGQAQSPDLTVKSIYNDTLTEGTDYTVEVPAGRTNAGTYIYTVTGIGIYRGTVEAVFTINPAQETLKAENVTLYSATVTYNGKVRTPKVTVKNAAGETLAENTDYTVAVPAGRTDPGEYVYVITGIGNYTGTVEAIFTINPAQETLKAENVTLYSATVTYNGKVRTPKVTVKNAAGETLAENTDYTVAVPAGRTDPGEYVYVITGKGNYTGTVNKVFTIYPAAEALKAENITLYSASVVYNGKVRTPKVTVKNAAGDTLTEGTDYTVAVPEGRTNAGTYTYVITGKGSYAGTVNKVFTINAQALSAANVTLYSASVVYNGKVRTPKVTVKNAAGDTLTEGTDYTVAVPEGRTNAGTYTYVITGKGNYKDAVNKVFTITPVALKAENITLYSASVVYNGKVRTPKVTVKNAAGDTLTEGTDYTVAVPEGRTNAGTYTYVITGKGNYAGTVNKVFTITPQAVSAAKITLYAATVEYNGKVRTPKVTVKNAAGETLVEGVDYTVTVPAGRKDVGEYTYVITGIGNYGGAAEKIFTIKGQTLKAENITLYSETVTYNGKVRTPKVTVKNAAGETLTEGTDYTVIVPAGRKDAGEYIYKITGKGNYAGTVNKTFTIRPAS